MPEHLPDFLSTLPHAPGVYRMLDEQGTVLYVGKAIDLKKRVSQYFQKNLTHPKTQALIRQVTAIEISLTRSETEALLLENNLIKRLQPKYNILLRDDKTYPYLLIQTEHPFPRMSIYRHKLRAPKGQSFGPFPNTSAVHETLQTLQRCFKLRNCQDSVFNHRSRPCLQYQIKRCTAPCTGYISQADYHANVEKATQFLKGESSQVIEQLSQQLASAVKQLEFEKAASLRDQIRQLRLIQQSQAMVQGNQNVDVIAIHSCIELVIIRQGQVIHNQAYFPTQFQQALLSDQLEERWLSLFEAFMRFYYLEQPDKIPPLILTESHLPNTILQTYEQALSSLAQRPCRIHNKARGIEKGWLDFALNNLQHHLEQQITETHPYAIKIQTLGQYFERTFKKLICFDVSHTHGESTVASAVVFTSEGPDRPSYRRFNIEGHTPGDDYAAIKNAILRYLKRLIQNRPLRKLAEESLLRGDLERGTVSTKQEVSSVACLNRSNEASLPDLLLIDGGKGQVHAAAMVLRALNLKGITLLGITKGEKRKACFDRIFDASTETFLDLSADSPALHLLQHLRDEAHRFAIQGHRKKREKMLLGSSLEEIEGIGPKRRKALLQYFGGLQGLQKATFDELIKVPGISPALAKRLLTGM